MDSLSSILNLIALISPFVPAGGTLGTIVEGVVRFGPAIQGLIKAGRPVEEAVKAHSDELWDAIKVFGAEFSGPQIPALGDAPEAPDTASVIGRAIFLGPAALSPEEQAWFDRASAPTGF